MPFVRNGSANVYWDSKGDGEALLLVMGHAYDSRMWHRVIPAFADRYRVVWFDNRGAGRTEWDGKPFGISDLAADAVSVLDAAGVDQAHVYGVSMGGLTAQEIALSAPDRVRSLILGCTGAMPDEPVAPAPPPRLRAFAMRRLPRRLMLRLMLKMSYGSGTPRDVIAEDRRIIESTPGGLPGRLAQGAAVASYHNRAGLASLDVPTLVLHGDQDRTVPWAMGRELADLIPGAQFVTLPGEGHNYLTSVDALGNVTVRDFLARQVASSS
jgi:3-oxoadipate enol-lactonase